jgi:hypothetical protein
MTLTQVMEFGREVEATAQRLFDCVRQDVARHGPWVYARFWRLASELPIIKDRIAWRDDTIQRYQELANRQWQALMKRKNPERNKERTDEIMRLHGLGLTPGRIRLQIRKRWPTLETAASYRQRHKVRHNKAGPRTAAANSFRRPHSNNFKDGVA